jgi:sec-independent protein translocase protein TatB
MFNVGTGELLVILLLALIVLGPDKLPEFARKVGRVTSELRRMSQGFQSEMRQAIDFSDDDDHALSRAGKGPRLVPPPPEATAPDRGLDDGDDPAPADEPGGTDRDDGGPSSDTSAA